LQANPLIRQAARKVEAANTLFPDASDDRFGDAAGEAIENCQRALGICGGPLADQTHETIMELAIG